MLEGVNRDLYIF